MTTDNFVALISTAISFAALLLVVLQLRQTTRQQELSSLVDIYDINRELISLGFSHPQHFAILQDSNVTDPVWERRYLQLWLNQLSLIHSFLKRSVVDEDLSQSLRHNLADFMTLENMRRHWEKNRSFYPVSFQTLVNDILKKGEPPPAAHVSSGS